MTIRGIYKLRNVFFMIFQKTHFYAILRNFSLINVQKYFAWLSFRSFPATMAIFNQIGDGPVTKGLHFGDSLVHPLLMLFALTPPPSRLL